MVDPVNFKQINEWTFSEETIDFGFQMDEEFL